MIQTQNIKLDKATLLIMGCIALAFGYIVTKDVALPPVVIIGGFIAGAVILFIKGIENPAMVTYVFVAYLPFSKVLVGDFGGLATALNLTNLLMLFIIFVWLTGKYSEGEPLWLSTSLNLPILLFMLAGFISIARGHYFAGHLSVAIIEYKRWIAPFFLYFLVLNTVKKREMIQNVIIIMMIVTTIVGLMAIYDYMDLGPNSSFDQARIGGIANQPNMLAAFFNYYMFLPFAFLLLNSGRFKYWLLMIPFLIQFRGIMVTFSRGGYLAFALGIYAIIFFRSKMLFMLLLFVTAAAYLNPNLLPTGVRYRMSQTITPNTSYVQMIELNSDSLGVSAGQRIEVWKGGLKLVKDHPFFGVGYGLFEPMIKHYWSGNRAIDAHNNYLLIAGEMGIPALIIFLWILFVIFRNCRGLYLTTSNPFAKATALGLLGGIFGLLMSNMFGSRLVSQEISGFFWILAALMMRLRILDAQESSKVSIHEPSIKVEKLDSCWVK